MHNEPEKGVYEMYDVTEEVGQSLLKDNLKFEIVMENGILKLDWVKVKSSLVYGAFWGLLAILLEINDAGSIFNLDLKALADAGVMAFIASTITLTKNMLTTKKGNFLGLIKVVPESK